MVLRANGHRSRIPAIVGGCAAIAPTPTTCWPGTAPRAPRRPCSTCAARRRGRQRLRRVRRPAGNVRPAWQELAECVGERGGPGSTGCARSCAAGRQRRHHLLQVDGHGEQPRTATAAAARPVAPRRAAAGDLGAGLGRAGNRAGATVAAARRRARRPVRRAAIDHQRSAAAQLLFAHPGYVRAARGIEVPGRHQLFLHGCDVSRLRRRRVPGERRLDAGAVRRRLRAGRPTGRRARDPRPLRADRSAARLAVGAGAAAGAHRRRARVGAQEPVVVVLSPGIHSETAFDQAYLASVLGFPLVESADLVVRDGKLWMRSLGTLKRVDVVLRRVDADLRRPAGPARRLAARRGRPGRGAAPRRGDRREHVGQRHPGKPWAATLSARAGRTAARRDAAAGHRADVLGRHRHRAFASAGEPVVAADQAGHRRAKRSSARRCRRRERDELAARIEATPWQWVGQELPQFSSAPTDYAGGLSAGGVGMRLFTVAQRGGYAPMIGGLGYLLAPGTRRTRMNTVAAKDIWVRPTERAADRDGDPAAAAELPAMTGPDTGRQLAARAVRPVLARSLRRTRREHGPAADRHPRALPRIPVPPGHGGKRVRAGAAGRARPHHRHRHRRRRRRRRDRSRSRRPRCGR